LFHIDYKITKFFDDELPLNAHENLEKITIRHLLTMSSGIHDNTYSELFVKSNWVSAFLAQEFHVQGTTEKILVVIKSIIMTVYGNYCILFLLDSKFKTI